MTELPGRPPIPDTYQNRYQLVINGHQRRVFVDIDDINIEAEFRLQSLQGDQHIVT